MTLPVRLSPDAEADLASIEWWIADQARSEAPASRYGSRLRARCARIGLSPLAGASWREVGGGIRKAVFERSAVILYRVEPDHVLVLRILRRGRDVEGAVRS